MRTKQINSNTGLLIKIKSNYSHRLYKFEICSLCIQNTITEIINLDVRLHYKSKAVLVSKYITLFYQNVICTQYFGNWAHRVVSQQVLLCSRTTV